MQQEYEDNNVEVYPVPETHGKRFWLIAGYFLILAVLMVPANALHMGMMGVLIAMGIGAGLLFGFLLLFKIIQKKLSHLKLTRRQWAEMAMGLPPGQVVPASSAKAEIVQADPLLTRKLSTTDLALPEEAGLPTRIIENNGLYLSYHFLPDINTLFGQIVLICGIRRSGKSNLLAVLIEEMAPYDVPMLIVDTDDEYAPLSDHSYLPRGFNAGSSEFAHIDPQPYYIPLRTCDGYSSGRKIAEEHLQVVLNMKSYTSDDEAALVLCELVRGMNEWEQEHQNKDRIPVFLFMDEAPKWLPQDMRDSVVSKTTQHYLYRTFFGTVVNRGGKQGWGAAFAGQRIQQLHKAVMQAPWKFLFYQTQKVDVEQYKAFGLPADGVMSLQRGECYIFSPSVIGFRTVIRKRTSPHLGNTPGLEELIAHRQQVRPVQALRFDLMPVTVSNEPSKETPEQPIADEQPSGLAYPLTHKQEQALDLYRDGKTTHREIAAAMKISDSDAYRLLIQLDNAGYIQRRKLPVN